MTFSSFSSVRWPAVVTRWRAPTRATVARVIFERAVAPLPVRVSYPDGRVLGAGSAASPEMEIVRPAALFARLGRDAKIGFGEGYMAGDWRAGSGADLADLLTPFASRVTTLIPPALQRLRVLVDRRVPPDQENTLDGSRANIAAHYDLSNDLFAAFLDPTMSYSCAWFDGSEPLATASALQKAQLRKIDGILDLAGVDAGIRLLEIGSGWGSLALRAAQRGARVTTITLSREQMLLARDRVEAAGLSHLVEVRVQDYREVDGRYDAIVSVEMIEAVGEAYWPTYFATLDRLLAPGGRVAIQAITMAHERFLATRRSFSWIQKYIFPGGIIPSRRAVDDTLAAHTTLRVTRQRELGPHYARTLRLWREDSSTSGRTSTPRVSTRLSAACGSSTSPTARPASAAATSESASSRWPGSRHEANWQGRLGRRRLQRNRRRRGTRTRKTWRNRGGLSPPQRSASGCCGWRHARPPRRRHRHRLGCGRSSPSPGGVGLDRRRGAIRWLLEADGSQQLGHRTLRQAHAGQPHWHEQRHRGGPARDAATAERDHSRIASVAGYRGLAGAEAYGATKAAQINLLESLRIHLARTGVQVTTVCPGFVRTDLTIGNHFPMPFIIDADQAARSICDGLERDRAEIVFPARMAVLMKAARIVPVRAWTALWKSASLR